MCLNACMRGQAYAGTFCHVQVNLAYVSTPVGVYVPLCCDQSEHTSLCTVLQHEQSLDWKEHNRTHLSLFVLPIIHYSFLLNGCKCSGGPACFHSISASEQIPLEFFPTERRRGTDWVPPGKSISTFLFLSNQQHDVTAKKPIWKREK